jgi:hypothetical protein
MNGGMQQLDGIARMRLFGSGVALLTDPQFALQNTTITNSMGADGYSWSQASPILIDQHEKLIVMAEHSGGNHNFVYCNNPNNVTPIWHDNSGYVDEAALTRGCVALDTTNDVLHVLWAATAASDGIIYRRYTITRDGSNNITSISKDTGVNLQMDFQGAGTMSYEHPILFWAHDGVADGTYGKLLAIWSARNGGGGGGNEVRASMCVLGATADRGKTAANWAAPNTADTTGIGNAPAVAYSILATGGSSIIYPSALRKASNTNAGDIYLFYADGGSPNTWTWRRLKWKSASNDWSNGLTVAASVSAIGRAGADTGYSLKQQLGTHPVEDTSGDRVYFGFATWKSNTDGDTWSFVYVDSADTLSAIVDVYSAAGAHSYAPAGDVSFDSTSGRLIVTYIKTSTQATYIQGYNGTTQTFAETLVFSTQPVDIPLIGPTTRITTGVLPILFRDTQATHKGWYGSMLWAGGSRDTSSGASVPSDITGLLLWWKTPISGATNNVAITSWPDSSGNGKTATPNGTGIIYRTGVINGLAVAESAGDYLLFTSTNLGTAHSVFLVIRPKSAFVDGVILGGNANGKYTPYLDATDIYYRPVSTDSFVTVAHGGLTTNTPYLLEIIRNGTSVSFYKNGAQIGTTQTLSANTALAIEEISGTAGANFPVTDLQIAEIFVFDTALSAANRQAMETYVSGRFAFF